MLAYMRSVMKQQQDADASMDYKHNDFMKQFTNHLTQEEIFRQGQVQAEMDSRLCRMEKDIHASIDLQTTASRLIAGQLDNMSSRIAKGGQAQKVEYLVNTNATRAGIDAMMQEASSITGASSSFAPWQELPASLNKDVIKKQYDTNAGKAKRAVQAAESAESKLKKRRTGETEKKAKQANASAEKACTTAIKFGKQLYLLEGKTVEDAEAAAREEVKLLLGPGKELNIYVLREVVALRVAFYARGCCFIMRCERLLLCVVIHFPKDLPRGQLTLQQALSQRSTEVAETSAAEASAAETAPAVAPPSDAAPPTDTSPLSSSNSSSSESQVAEEPVETPAVAEEPVETPAVAEEPVETPAVAEEPPAEEEGECSDSSSDEPKDDELEPTEDEVAMIREESLSKQREVADIKAARARASKAAEQEAEARFHESDIGKEQARCRDLAHRVEIYDWLTFVIVDDPAQPVYQGESAILWKQITYSNPGIFVVQHANGKIVEVSASYLFVGIQEMLGGRFGKECVKHHKGTWSDIYAQLVQARCQFRVSEPSRADADLLKL